MIVTPALVQRGSRRKVGPAVSATVLGLAGFTAALCLCSFLGDHAEHDHTPGQFAVAFFGVVVVTSWAAMEGWRSAREEPGHEDDDYEALVKETATPTKQEATDAWGNALQALRCGSEFAFILAVVYACDRTTLARSGPKYKDSRAFWGVWAAICVAALLTLRGVSRPKVLAREQTEEWKGWMQIMFLLYHYFNEAELYNAIRVYIAAYVWMTGYGNFLYYQKTSNFGIVRIIQTLFRLNFFVFFICVALRNEYMLYYICPMHTAFTLFVWVALRIWKDANLKTTVVVGKILVTLAFTYALYDIESAFRLAFGWQPLRNLLAFHDPLHPEFTDELHEWQFRSGLDRFIWIFGMACAAFLPSFEAFLTRLDAIASVIRKCSATFGFVGAALAVLTAWTVGVYVKEKYAYNIVHPYTSWIPITVYIVLRNLHPVLRSFHLHLFAFLGKITLETYILQFHVWMHSTGLNGSPKSLLFLLPPDYYWSNFIVVTAFYLLLSHRIFFLTGQLKDCLVPTDSSLLLRRSLLAVVVAAAFYGTGWLWASSWAVRESPLLRDASDLLES